MVRLMICLSALLLGGGADLLSARGRELVAGSYNIRCDTPVDGDNAWPYRKERVEALIRFYGFDVLGVQEAKPSQMSDLHTKMCIRDRLCIGPEPSPLRAGYALLDCFNDFFECCGIVHRQIGQHLSLIHI